MRSFYRNGALTVSHDATKIRRLCWIRDSATKYRIVLRYKVMCYFTLQFADRMGSSSQLYSLSWGEFSSSLTSAVQLLRGHGDLVDVTLAAGGRSFPAHKIVLCAASPFLLDLLKVACCLSFFFCDNITKMDLCY